jgi:hypothetical protein
MDSEEVSMQAEVVLTSATVGRDLGKQITVIRKEKISAYFTIAAAAFGLISDGCKSHCADYPKHRSALSANDTKTVKIRIIL